MQDNVTPDIMLDDAIAVELKCALREMLECAIDPQALLDRLALEVEQLSALGSPVSSAGCADSVFAALSAALNEARLTSHLHQQAPRLAS